MPNNASARRVKDKKNKSKKGEGSKKTDTLSLPKEDAASVDSGTLSLSSAGKDNSSKDSVDGGSLSLSVLGKEQARESSTLSSSVAGKEQARPGSCLALYERVRNRRVRRISFGSCIEWKRTSQGMQKTKMIRGLMLSNSSMLLPLPWMKE